ncbi:hypothetical protein FRZ40_13355 [Paraburkholderia azotifigens]|uniref:Uncharacterized protein n=1 Tax=Paraburkholderia azotifigens TaxID=2057004 RepID=A0A5C6VV69_9BURK|nr:hypothetical protein FRZ40_13355 [Paraburkholderia azotifigens]
MAVQEYEIRRTVEVEINGTRYVGSYRVMAGTVIVYFDGAIKSAPHDMQRPEVLGRWLLTDACKRVEAGRRDRSNR